MRACVRDGTGMTHVGVGKTSRWAGTAGGNGGRAAEGGLDEERQRARGREEGERAIGRAGSRARTQGEQTAGGRAGSRAAGCANGRVSWTEGRWDRGGDSEGGTVEVTTAPARASRLRPRPRRLVTTPKPACVGEGGHADRRAVCP